MCSCQLSPTTLFITQGAHLPTFQLSWSRRYEISNYPVGDASSSTCSNFQATGISTVPSSQCFYRSTVFNTSADGECWGFWGGVLLFIGITTHANPAIAQLFDTVEGEAEAIFWRIPGWRDHRFYLWPTAHCGLGFRLWALSFFAVYQAQRG